MQDRTIFLERLKVRKRWYKGLADDHVDHRMPDIRDTFEGQLLQEEEPGQVGARAVGMPLAIAALCPWICSPPVLCA